MALLRLPNQPYTSSQCIIGMLCRVMLSQACHLSLPSAFPNFATTSYRCLTIRQVLLVDGCMGVVTAGVVERLGGRGCACVTHVDGKVFIQESLKHMNLTQEQLGAMCGVTLDALLEAKVGA